MNNRTKWTIPIKHFCCHDDYCMLVNKMCFKLKNSVLIPSFEQNTHKSSKKE